VVPVGGGLPQRVVTLDALPEDWDGVNCIQVPRGAVVTPSVRDELRQRGVHSTIAVVPRALRMGCSIGAGGRAGQGQPLSAPDMKPRT
jgi:hypothetical protein